jgi:hypothetical protein
MSQKSCSPPNIDETENRSQSESDLAPLVNNLNSTMTDTRIMVQQFTRDMRPVLISTEKTLNTANSVLSNPIIRWAPWIARRAGCTLYGNRLRRKDAA